MKEFTKKIFETVPIEDEAYISDERNAEGAKEQLKMPKELYLYIARAFSASRLCFLLEKENCPTSSFMAGFMCGWAEANKKIE